MGDADNNQNAGGGAADNKNNTSNATGATDATKTGQGDSGSGFDTKTIKDQDFERIFDDPRLFNHPRFKSLNDQAREAKTLREEKEAAQKKQLEDEKRYQELAQVNENKAKEWQAKAETSSVNNAILMEANKQGIVDPDAVIKLIDRGQIKLNEDGTVSGVQEAVKALTQSKPYLVGKGNNNTRVGGGTGPSDQDTTTPRFKHSQLKDPAFFRKHEKEIQEALRLNLVVDDLAPGNRT